jgi:hypothetical protein
MPKRSTTAVLLLLSALPAWADNCDAIRAQIDAKVRAGGVVNFRLDTVDAAAPAAGRVVGTCDLGKRKIVYVAGAPASVAAVPAGPASAVKRTATESIITECRDGSMPRDGTCRK